MSTKTGLYAAGVATFILVVLAPVDLQSTNQESTPLMQIGQNHSIAHQKLTVTTNLWSMPLAFTENQGQWDEQVQFRANAGGATMWFTRDCVYHQFTRRRPNSDVFGTPQLAVGMFGGYEPGG